VLRHVQPDDGVAGLVVGGQLLLVLRHHHAAPLGAHHDLVLGVLELQHGDEPLGAARRHQRRLVDEIGKIRAREAGGAACDRPEIDIGRQRHVADMDLEDLLATVDVRIRHHHLPVEAARPQQGGVENVRAVGRRDQDDSLIRLEAVHLDQQLVQRLLAFVVAAPETGTAMPPDGVDLVDEDDAGAVLLGLLKHVPHTARADADEHFDKVGAGDREERHIRFAGDGARQEGLTGARRAHQQNATGDLAAQTLEFLRLAQEFDDLLQILLRLVDAGHILEGDPAMRFRQKLGLRLAEAHRLAARAALHLPHQEDPDREDQEDRTERQQHRPDWIGVVARRSGIDLDVLRLEPPDQRRVFRRVGLERRGAVGIFSADPRSLDNHRLHPARIDVGQELRIGDLAGSGGLGAIRKQLEQSDQKQRDDRPEGEVSKILVHQSSWDGRPRPLRRFHQR